MEYTKSYLVSLLHLPPSPILYPRLVNLITPMKSTKVRTHEDHALLLLPRTATLSQMKHKSMPRFLNVLSPSVNLRQKKKTAVSRTNSAFTVANWATWHVPVGKNKNLTPNHVTLSRLAPLPPKRKPPWMMKITPVPTSPPCTTMSTLARYRRIPSQLQSLRIFSLTYCCAVNRFPLCFLCSCKCLLV